MDASENYMNTDEETSCTIIDGHDNEVRSPVFQHYQLISQNQQDGKANGHFLTLNDKDGKTFKVTADGDQDDVNAVWISHYTTTKNNEFLVILESERSLDQYGKRLVLGTVKDDKTNHYALVAQEMEHIPKQLDQIDPTKSFLRKTKCPGSEMIYFEAACKGDGNQRLLIGFDSSGQPLPMNNVQEFMTNSEPYFKIIRYTG